MILSLRNNEPVGRIVIESTVYVDESKFLVASL